MNGVIYTNDIYERQNVGSNGSTSYVGAPSKKPLRLEALGNQAHGQSIAQQSAKKGRKKHDIDIIFAR